MSNTYSDLYKMAIDAFDAYNQNDPNLIWIDQEHVPQELLYSQRMTACLNSYENSPTELMSLAVRCQHIGRWEIKRNTYSMDKMGYFKWRETLKLHHAQIVIKLLKQIGYDDAFIQSLVLVLSKKKLKKDAQSQLLEDVICLVFLEYYFDAFAAKHEDKKSWSGFKKRPG